MAHPLPLDDLLAVLAVRGLLQHLSISKTPTGLWQASMKRQGTSSYSVSIKEELVDAVWGACSPGWGVSWTGYLGEDLGTLVDQATAPEDDDDDELEDIL